MKRAAHVAIACVELVACAGMLGLRSAPAGTVPAPQARARRRQLHALPRRDRQRAGSCYTSPTTRRASPVTPSRTTPTSCTGCHVAGGRDRRADRGARSPEVRPPAPPPRAGQRQLHALPPRRRRRRHPDAAGDGDLLRLPRARGLARRAHLRRPATRTSRSRACCRRATSRTTATGCASTATRAASSGDLCETCHKQSFCASCHGVTAPALPATRRFADPMRASVHRAGFASRHSLEARAEPGACTTCHAPDRCAELPHRARRQRGTIAASPHPRRLGRADRWPTTSMVARPAAIRRRARACHGGAGEKLCVGCHAVGGVGGNPHPPGWSSRRPAQRDAVPDVPPAGIAMNRRAGLASFALIVAGRDPARHDLRRRARSPSPAARARGVARPSATARGTASTSASTTCRVATATATTGSRRPPADLCLRCHPGVRATLHPIDPLGERAVAAVPGLPRVRQGPRDQAGGLHALSRSRAGSPPRDRGALRSGLQRLPPRARDPHAPAPCLLVVSRRAADQARRPARLPRLPRHARGRARRRRRLRPLPRAATAAEDGRRARAERGPRQVHDVPHPPRVRQGSDEAMHDVPREQAGARRREPQDLHRLPRPARRRSPPRVHHVSPGGGQASRARTARRRGDGVRRLSPSARPPGRREGGRVRDLPPEAAARDRALPRLPHAARGEAGARAGAVREVPRRERAHDDVHGPRRVLRLSHHRGPLAGHAADAVRDLPQARGDDDGDPRRAPGLRRLPHRGPAPAGGAPEGLRDLPHRRGQLGAEGPPGVRGLPRAARWLAPPGRGVRDVPRRQDQGRPRGPCGVRDVSPPARSRRGSRARRRA